MLDGGQHSRIARLNMIYYDGKPILKFACGNRRALGVMFDTGTAPRAPQLLGRGGSTSYWMHRLPTGIFARLLDVILGHGLMLTNFGWQGAVKGCHYFFGRWPWGRFQLVEGEGSALCDHGEGGILARRLRYRLRTTSDPYVMIGKCGFEIWGRELFLGYVVLVRLGG